MNQRKFSAEDITVDLELVSGVMNTIAGRDGLKGIKGDVPKEVKSDIATYLVTLTLRYDLPLETIMETTDLVRDTMINRHLWFRNLDVASQYERALWQTEVTLERKKSAPR